jgi:uncharacterized protein
MYKSRYVLCIPIGKNEALLVSTLSGAIDHVKEDVLQIWQGDDALDKIRPETINFLKQRRYVFDSMSEENELVSRIQATLVRIEKMVTPSFVVIPSYNCNLACDYCYEGAQTSEANQMSETQINHLKRAIRRILNKQSAPIPNAKLTLMGGEPLLPSNIEIVKEILAYAQTSSMKVDIITNGTTLTQFAHLLKQFGVAGIQVTLTRTSRNQTGIDGFHRNGFGVSLLDNSYC